MVLPPHLQMPACFCHPSDLSTASSCPQLLPSCVGFLSWNQLVNTVSKVQAPPEGAEHSSQGLPAAGVGRPSCPCGFAQMWGMSFLRLL